MANVKKCDRCGKVYDRNSKHLRRYNCADRYYTGVAMLIDNGYCVDESDLCDDCLDAFGDFMSFYKRSDTKGVNFDG